MRGLILLVRFLVELALLAALAWWGFTVGSGVTAWVLGVGTPLLSAVIWGTFVAPKARRPVPVTERVAIECVLYSAAAIGLAAIGQMPLAIGFFVVAVTVSLANAATTGSAEEEMSG
jgi:Protein of unknown function (DUF2568)